MSSREPPSTFGQVFEAVRRIVQVRVVRYPDESLVSYGEGELEISCTAADEYEVRREGEVVFRAGATGGLSGEHVFEAGGWVEQVWRIDRQARGEKSARGVPEPSDKGGEAARRAGESRKKFRRAADRERGSRGGPTEGRLRVLGETIAEEREAVEEYGQAKEHQREARRERAAKKGRER